MPRHKPKRMGIRIDMTPLVDVAFLLLTFFMFTSQFKPQEEVEIAVPSSHSDIKKPEVNYININIAKDGRIFLGFDSQNMREAIFGKANMFKASVEVPKDKLADYLVQARVRNPKLVTVVTGDRNAEYGVAEDVMNILQKTQITRFNLVTNLETETK